MMIGSIVGSISILAVAMDSVQPGSLSDEARRAQALVQQASGAFVETNGRSVATAPRSAGYPGLCSATVADLQFNGSYAASLTTRVVYRVVGDLAPRENGWDDAYGAQLDAKCSSAGRVLTQNEFGLGIDQFFNTHALAGETPYPALLALQRAVAQAKAYPSNLACGHGGKLNCATELSKLSFEQLRGIGLKPCFDRTRAYCASASFSALITGNQEESVIVRFEIPLTQTGLSPDAENIEVGRSTIIIR